MKESCESCMYYSMGNEGEYGGGPYYMECLLMDELWKRTTANHDFTSDSPHFPFHPAPGCYRIDFWKSRFATMIDFSVWNINEVEEAFKKAVRDGEWILPIDGWW